jgi:hypothetical protein
MAHTQVSVLNAKAQRVILSITVFLTRRLELVLIAKKSDSVGAFALAGGISVSTSPITALN